MATNGPWARQYDLSYDKIIKRTLDRSDELTVRFINGLFGGGIPLDAKVEWLDKESVDDEYKALVADFYPRIGGRMYSVEVEQDGGGDMALRVFRYALGGALRHNMASGASWLNVTFPHPCVVFLRSGPNAPRELMWKMEFFDGQSVELRVPSIRLAEMSVEEIAERDLFPVGQFYLRTFEPLTERKLDGFAEAGRRLMAALKAAMERGAVPSHVAAEMQDVIRKTAENAMAKSKMEVDLAMHTSIIETLPWIDYGEVFDQIEARGRAAGEAAGRAEGRAEGEERERAKWRGAVADRDAALADREAEIARLRALLGGRGRLRRAEGAAKRGARALPRPPGTRG
jgi:hypothetical protein